MDARAAHLVGGDFSYRCTGNNLYEFTLTIYRDVLSPTGAQHDNPAYIFVYDLDDNSLYNSYSANLSGTPLVQNNELGCNLTNPDPPLLDFASYRYSNVSLPPNGRGYRIVYQRCCRSADALNLASNFDGFSQGSTYEIIIDPSSLSECDQPDPLPELKFEELPPTQWCANATVIVDQSVNADILTFADSVVYALCAPYEGGSGSNCIIPDPFSTGNCNDFDAQCSEPCLYSQVNYSLGYNQNQPMGAGSSVNINPQTGLLSVTPNNIGIYVVAICATAWKDGREYASISRDFSFKVFDCINDGAGDPIAIGGAPLSGTVIDSIGAVDAVYLICSDFEVTFDHLSGNNILSYYWDFGVKDDDADTSILEFPTYTYSDTGTYLITFIVNRGEICVDTAYGVVRVFPTVAPGFETDVGCFSLPVDFNDTTLSTLNNNQVIDWNWNFGDGNSVSGIPNPSHTYSASQSYNAQLTVTTELGCVDSVSIPVFPEPSPEAGIGNLLTCTGREHLLENLAELNGTDLASYSWDFGDGNGFSYTSSDVQPLAQVYADSGIYTVQMAVSSLNGCSDTVAAELIVVDQVEPGFTFNPDPVCPGQEIQFTNTTLQYFDSVTWVIDGNTLTENNPVYTYSTPGVKTIELSVFSNGICGDIITESILVDIGPFATFEVDSTCKGANFLFENNSLENGITIDSFIWDFGDGSTGVGFEPIHEYQEEGDFTVTVIAMTNLVCKDTATNIIPVKEGITTYFDFSPDTICEGLTTTFFENQTMGTSWDSVLWTFGDGFTGRGEMPEHLYREGGFYTVTMYVYDDICGEYDTARVIEILDIPQPVLPDTLNICDGIIEVLSIDNPDNYLVTWSTGDSLVSSIAIDNTPDSVIVLVDNRGCRNSDMMIVKRDCPAYLPSAFTPNGDGVNDRFLPLPLNITSFTLNIYNRWGELIYTTTDFDGWDGFYKGDPAPMDSYVYTFQGIGLDNKILNQFGTVMLLR
jgi:gliding motility-associated-like protein